MIGADYKSALQERLQAAGGTVPEYAVVEVTGPDHLRTFRVELRVVGRALAAGEGHTIKIAQQEAARAGLESAALPGVIEAIKQSQKRELEAESEPAATGFNSDSPIEHAANEQPEAANTGAAIEPQPEPTTSGEGIAAESPAAPLASAAAVDGSMEAGDDGRLSAEAEVGLTKF